MSVLVKKCNGILIGLSHVRHQIPTDLLPTLVNALVLSHVRYCLAVFGNGSEKNIQRLQKILNFALHTASGRRKFDHISDVREELGWPTARQLYEQHSLNFLHKIRCTGEPEPLPNFRSTLHSALGPQGRTLIWPSHACGPRREGGASFLALRSFTTVYRRKLVLYRWGRLSGKCFNF